MAVLKERQDLMSSLGRLVRSGPLHSKERVPMQLDSEGLSGERPKRF